MVLRDFENGALQQSKGLELQSLFFRCLAAFYTHCTQIQDQACLHTAFKESIFNGKQSKHLMPMRQQFTSSVQLVTIRSRLNRKYITHFCQQQLRTHINIPSLSAPIGMFSTASKSTSGKYNRVTANILERIFCSKTSSTYGCCETD